jgi:tRNA-guanine family transglycosylase
MDIEYYEKYGLWFKNSELLHYPHCLISYGVLGSNPKILDLGIKEFSKKGIILIDSGGYQVTKGVDLNPRRVFSFQKKLSDRGVILDSPPLSSVAKFSNGLRKVSSKQHFEFDYSKFRSSLERTKENIKVIKDEIDSDFKLYSVVQGREPEEIKIWIEELLSLGVNYYGWCLSVNLTDLYQWLFLVKILYLYGVRRIHFFAVGGHIRSLFLSYLAKVIPDLEITFDSSITSQSALRMRAFKDPLSPAHYYIGNRKEKEIEKIRCDCGVCKRFDLLKLGGSGEASLLISLHNISMLIKREKIFQEMSKEETEKLLLKWKVPEQIVRIASKIVETDLNFLGQKIKKRKSDFVRSL